MDDSLEKAFVFLRKILGGSRNFDEESSERIGLDSNTFRSFVERGCKRVAAIDGSSCDILDGEFFIIGGRRGGYVIADDEKILEREIGDINIDFLGKEGMNTGAVKELMHGIKIPENPHEVNEALRQMEEHLLAREVIKELERDDIILMDGTLEKNEFISKIMEENFEMARQRGIHVVGVSKKCGLFVKNVSMINRVKRNGDKLFPKERWYYPFFEGCYIVKFHPLSRFVFRVDINPGVYDIEKILGEIATVCNDVCFLGYPYPLADIHNHIVIKSHDSFAIQMRLQEMAIENGFGLEEWEALFFDYHEYLR